MCLSGFLIRMVGKGDALSPLIFDFALEYAIRRFQVDLEGLKLNDMHQLLIYDDYNILRCCVRTIKNNTDTSGAGGVETGIEEMLIKLCIWSCLGIRKLDEFTMLTLVIGPLKVRNG